MGTSTTRFELFKPAGSDTVREEVDLGPNWDKIDDNSFPMLGKQKDVDTARASTTVLTADPELTITTVAKDYLLEGTLFVEGNGSEAGRFKVIPHHTGAAMGSWVAVGNVPSSSSPAGDINVTAFSDVSIVNTGSSTSIQTAAEGLVTVLIEGLIRVTTAGNFEIHWAQSVSHATATTLLRNSWIKLTRLN